MNAPAQARGGRYSEHRRSGGQNTFTVCFDPEASPTDLFDTKAEQQAKAFPEGRDAVNSSQLRRFFGEVKDLYRQFEARAKPLDENEREQIYRQEIEPRFKMVRSKVSYASRAGQSKVPEDFAKFLKTGIERVRPGNVQDFRHFVMHFEAVVGFMYGLGKVSK